MGADGAPQRACKDPCALDTCSHVLSRSPGKHRVQTSSTVLPVCTQVSDVTWQRIGDLGTFDFQVALAGEALDERRDLLFGKLIREQ